MKVFIISIAVSLISLSSFAETSNKCEAPILKPGQYLLNGSEKYVCGIRVGEAYGDAFYMAYVPMDNYNCDVRLPSNDFLKVESEFGVYINKSKTHKVRVLDERSFMLEGYNNKRYLYEKRGY